MTITGTVEFGDFVRCVGTYCFFGKQELLRFMFVFADKDMKGSITHAQFVTLLNTLNPFDKQRAKRALQELQMIPDKNMEFDQVRTEVILLLLSYLTLYTSVLIPVRIMMIVLTQLPFSPYNLMCILCHTPSNVFPRHPHMLPQNCPSSLLLIMMNFPILCILLSVFNMP